MNSHNNDGSDTEEVNDSSEECSPSANTADSYFCEKCGWVTSLHICPR